MIRPSRPPLAHGSFVRGPGAAILAALIVCSGVRTVLAQAPKGIDSTLVSIEVNRRQYDPFQPWSQQGQTSVKGGIVISPREILTTAHDLDNAILLRVQRGGRGPWTGAAIEWVDYAANLALISVKDPAFWKGLKPVRLNQRLDPAAAYQISRWRAGNLENRRAEFSRFTVSNGALSDTAHVVMEMSSELQGAGWAEPVFSGGRLSGLVTAQTGGTLQVLPSPFIHSILEARRAGRFTGLGYFDFTWQPAENPNIPASLHLPGTPRGVVVIDTASWPVQSPVFRRLDVILGVDGFAIDTQGDYTDPVYGHLLLENLASRNRWTGDTVKFQVWRDGALRDLDYKLPGAANAARLVPAAAVNEPPEYLIVGGLVFQPLTKDYLRAWGQDWERRAPFRLAYFRYEEPSAERPGIVVLSQILPDTFNIGYAEARYLVLQRVNGHAVSDLAGVRAALGKPVDGFHVLEFMRGESLQKIVLDATLEQAATQRVLKRYGIDEPLLIRPRPAAAN